MKCLRYISLILMVGVLSACSFQHSPNFQSNALGRSIPPQYLSKLKGLSVPLLYPNGQEFDNCSFDQQSLPEQKMLVRGSNGGYALATPKLSQRSIWAETLGTDIQKSFFSNALPDRDTAILIADNFGNDVYTLGEKMYNLSSWDETVLAKQEQLGNLSHGAMVMNHINALLLGSGQYTPSRFNKNTVIWTAASKNKPSRRIVVVGVNTSLSNTHVISDRIKRTFTDLRNNVTFDGPSIINMSFGIMPCEILMDFEKSKGQKFSTSPSKTQSVESFQDYMAALYWQNQSLAANYDALVHDVIESANLPNDPLLKLIQDPAQGATRHVYVASAGNFGLDIPIYPASWKEAISVGGSSFDDPKHRAVIENPPGSNQFEPLFNNAEIMDVGASFVLTNPANLNGQHKTKQPFFYAGTSFSAPTISVFSALDLASTRRCANGRGKSKLAHGVEDLNLQLQQVVGNASYCP